ncbi:hypothetical protein SAMN02927924_03934 [Sphingobium faniae]|nr:hypothetical protein SAMN02927924_03934 [Sphingobium faniae]
MRKTTLLTAAVSCLATLSFVGTGLAQPAPATPHSAPAQPTPSAGHAHQQGMAGMSGGSATANGSGIADKPKSGCCKMPMKKAKPMSDM